MTPPHRTRLSSGALLALVLVPVLAGCGGHQNTLDPHSKPERAIANLWWVMLAGAAVGFGVICVLLFVAWVRRNRAGLPGGGGDRGATIAVVALGVAVPIVILLILFVWADVFVLKSTAAPNPKRTALTIEVIGHQWFWEVRYPGSTAVTANEIHIPVGTPVNLVATTDDVIHSFWVPELNRKIDMIPGRRNRILLEANSVGFYRGTCSEYCGLQHAHMAIGVYAEPLAQFRRWLAREAAPAPKPAAALARQGARAFQALPCASCHQIRGTSAHGRVGPDLTHVGLRHTLAALTIPNTPADMREWIRDPQHVKPGNLMVTVATNDSNLQALVTYLQGLK